MQYGPDKPAFGGGPAATVLHPIILVATIVAVILIFVLPRKKVAVPFLLLVFLGSYGQQVYIAGVHLFVLRIIILAGLFRMAFALRADGPPWTKYMSCGWLSVFWLRSFRAEAQREPLFTRRAISGRRLADTFSYVS